MGGTRRVIYNNISAPVVITSGGGLSISGGGLSGGGLSISGGITISSV